MISMGKESLARQKASREWEEECFSNEERRQRWDEDSPAINQPFF
jgi:hypothetical protein